MPLPDESIGFYNPPGMPLPTVAHDRGHGITSVRVFCAAGLICSNYKVFTFDELDVPDEMPILHFPAFAASSARNAGAARS